jgi:hypothetical protein
VITGRAVLDGCASLTIGADGRAKATSGVGRLTAGGGLLVAASLAAGGGLLGEAAIGLAAGGGLLCATSLVASGGLGASSDALLDAARVLSVASSGALLVAGGGLLGAAAGGAKGVAMPIKVCERSELERATGAAGG